MTAVIVVGDLMADVVATVTAPLAHASDTPAEIVRRPGGGGANVAARLAAAGVPTLLVARVGEDAAGQAALAELREGGVELEIAIDAQRPTGTCVVIVEPGGERTMLPDRGANAALEPADLPIDEFTEGKHLHLSGYTLLDPGSRSAGLVALEHARAAGMSISVDPASAAPLADLGSAAFLGWTRRAGLLLPNAEEAAVLTGARDPEAAAWALAKDGREVVITLGKEGALWSDGERVERGRASPAPARVDSTGAGDAFTAGWLAARLSGEEPVRGPGRGQLRRGAGAQGGGRALTRGVHWAGAGRAEDLDAVLGGDAAEDLRADLVERGDRDHEALEAARRARDQHARAVGADLVAVRDAARGEDEVTGAQRHRLAGQVQRDLAAEAVEALVLVAMDMQRRHLAGGHVHVDEAVVLAGGEHARGGAEKVQVCSRGGHGGLLR